MVGYARRRMDGRIVCTKVSILDENIHVCVFKDQVKLFSYDLFRICLVYEIE